MKSKHYIYISVLLVVFAYLFFVENQTNIFVYAILALLDLAFIANDFIREKYLKNPEASYVEDESKLKRLVRLLTNSTILFPPNWLWLLLFALIALIIGVIINGGSN